MSVCIALAPNNVKESAEIGNILKSLFAIPWFSEHVSLVELLVVADLVPGVLLDVVHVEEHEAHGETDEGKDVSEGKGGDQPLLQCRVVHSRPEIMA